jgi:hypothetical protein
MSDVIEFKLKDETRHDKIAKAIESKEFICFWHNKDGYLSYTIGTDITTEQMAFMEKVLGIVVTDTMKEEMSWT